MLIGAVESALRAQGIGRGGEQIVVVGCSGGIDSVVLTHAATTLLGARRVVVAHVDHGVRQDSGADRAFVEGYASALGCAFASRRVSPASDAEADLRVERYGALEAIREATGAAWILTAHTEDDQAESVLINLVRQTDPQKLSGIPRRRDVILRPLLDVPRHEVGAYAARHGLTWREDPSNREPRYLRNRVRKELMPLLDRMYRPGIRRRLAQLARGVSERIDRADDTGVVRSESDPVVPIPRRPFTFQRRPWGGGAIPDGRNVAIFDAATVEGIQVRPLEDGDRIRPFGHSGRRKVRDVLREAGVPAAERPAIWVVEAAGDILWVPGLVRSSAAPVQETTTDVWVFWTAGTSELQGEASRATLRADDST